MSTVDRYKMVALMVAVVLIFSLLPLSPPVQKVLANGVTVTISSPTAAPPAYVKQGGSLAVEYTLSGLSDNVNITAEIYAGSTSYSLIGNYSRGNGGPYTDNFMLPAVVAEGTYNLKLYVWSDPPVSGTSLNSVKVDNTKPNITIISPTATTCWKANTQVQLQWSAYDTGNTEPLRIYAWISTNGGGDWTPIDLGANPYPQGAQTFNWSSCPDGNYPATKLMMQARDKAGNESDYVYSPLFNIIKDGPQVTVTSPAENAVLNGGSTQSVQATIQGYGPTVQYRILLSTNGGSTFDRTIKNWTSGDFVNNVYNLSQQWTVPNDVRSSTCQIKVEAKDCAGKEGNGTSGTFRIKDVGAPDCSISAPTSTSRWCAGTTQEIKWTCTDNAPGNLLCSLYYSTDGGNNYFPIWSGSKSQGANTHQWNIPGMLNSNNCKIKCVCCDQESPPNCKECYSQTFTIARCENPPVVSNVTAVNSSQGWKQGTAQVITWSASDPDDPQAKLTYTIELCSPDGTVIAVLPNQPQGSRSFTWGVCGSPGSHQIKVTAYNPNSGLSGEGTSAPFQITANTDCPVCEPSPALNLSAGWHLISLPLIPLSTSITNVIGPIADKVEAVWYYDPTVTDQDKRWKSWTPTKPTDSPTYLATMEAGKAYWIKLSDSISGFAICGRPNNCDPVPSPAHFTYVYGWNMVGLKSQTAKEVENYLPQDQAKHSTPISGYFNGSGFTLSDNDDWEPWRGCWVFFTGSGPWTANTPLEDCAP